MIDKTKPIGTEASMQEINVLRSDEKYQHFVEGLLAEVTETEFNIREKVYQLYHSIGKQIAEQTEYFTRSKVYGEKIAELISEDVKKSPRTIWYAMQFYKTYPNLEEFVSKQSKDLSWYKITQKFLPKHKANSSEQTIKQEIQQQNNNESNFALVDNLDTATFTIRENLDLFLKIKTSDTTTAFANLLKNKFIFEEIRFQISRYSEGKKENLISFLKELESQIGSSEYVVRENNNVSLQMSPLFGDIQTKEPTDSISKNQKKEKEQSLTPQLISRFEQLFYKKFKQKPAISKKSWMIWGRQLKIKIGQGYSFDEILTLLQIYADSKDSDPSNLGFNLSTFFSDAIFNKMQALKSKNSNIVLEGKYARF